MHENRVKSYGFTPFFFLSQQTKSEFSFSSKTYQEFNQYLTAMVGCLWTSKPFQKGLYIDPEVLGNASVAEYKKSLNLVHHPAFLSYTVSFLLQVRIFKQFLDFLWEYHDGTNRKFHKFSVSELQDMCSVILFEYQLTSRYCARLWGFKVSFYPQTAWVCGRDRFVNVTAI